MHFPNPTDVIANPVRYWTDVALMQIEFGRQVYGMVASINPYLPKDGYVMGAAELPVPARRAKRTVRRAAPRPAPKPADKPAAAEAVVAMPVAKKAEKPVVKVAAEVVAKPETKVQAKTAKKPVVKAAAKPAPKGAAKAAQAPKRGRRPARKGVTLAPDLPPSKTTKSV